MIPDFDEAGFLPHGIHDATWQELVARFSGGRQRQRVLRDLKAWLKHVQAAGCRTAYIDGSFVSAKEEPGDFDACFDIDGVDMAKLHPSLLDRSPQGIQKIKDEFGGDIRLDREFPPGSISPYVRFFQFDSRSGRKKGIIRIDLSAVRL